MRSPLALPFLLVAVLIFVVCAPGPSAPTPAVSAAAPTPSVSGYAVATAGGSVATFGGAGFRGDLSTLTGAGAGGSRIVGMAATPDAHGYWLVARSGAVWGFGTAQVPFPGWRSGSRPIVGIAADPATHGYWLVDDQGQVYAFNAPQLPMASLTSSGSLAGMAAAAGGNGVWLATTDGHVISSGTTPIVTTQRSTHGSTTRALRGPFTGIASTPGGFGYWTVTRAGAVRAAGDARSFGSGRLPSPVKALVPTPDGGGYLLVHQDGHLEAFGDAKAEGDIHSPLHPPLYPAFYSVPAANAIGAAYVDSGPQRAPNGPLRITFLGDSLSVLTARYTKQYLAAHHHNALVANGGIQGCGVSGNLPVAIASHRGPPVPTLPACAQWQQQYAQWLAISHPDVVAVLLGYWESQRHSYLGTTFNIASSPGYRDYLTAQLNTLAFMVHAAGAALVLLTAPYYGDGTPSANVDVFNSLLRSVAAQQGATVFDLNTLLDPAGRFDPTVDGVTARSSDLVHVTQSGVTRVIDGVLVPQLEIIAAGMRLGPTN